jgi:hypothetical protein
MLKQNLKTIAAALTMLLGTGAAQAAVTVNGFANGGFETAGTGDLAANWDEGNRGYSRVCGSAGNGSDCAAQLLSPQIAAAVVVQNSVDQGLLPDLTVGDNPLLSFSAKGFAGTQGNANFALRYLDSTGNIMSNSGPLDFHTLINTSTWTEITFDLGVVPVGATAAFLEIVQAIGPIGTGPAGENWLAGEIFIDDVYLGVTAVPVPAAVWLFGSGLLGLIGVARRKKVA